MPRSKSFDEAIALEKAVQVFWKKGFNATSMEDLVAAMGINRASLYGTFGDKKTLYMAALAQFSAKTNRENGHLASRNSGSPRAQLTAILRASLADALADPDQKGCMLANATAEMAVLDGDVLRFSKTNIESMEKMFAELIRAGQKTGEINDRLDVEGTAFFLINFVHGMRVVCKIGPDAAKIRQSMEVALAVLD